MQSNPIEPNLIQNSSFHLVSFIITGRRLSLPPSILGRGTQWLDLFLLQPVWLTFDISDPVILLATSKEIDPVLQCVVNLLLCVPELLGLDLLELFLTPVGVNLGIIDGEVHELDPAHICCAVVGEAARYETAGSITGGKVVVRTSGTVNAAAS